MGPVSRTALARATSELLAARSPKGHWVGELSSSALSTATAVTAMAVSEREAQSSKLEARIESGLEWLAQHVNSDGGWGDTSQSISNLSTTTLCWAAFGVVTGAEEQFASTLASAEGWLKQHAGGLEPEHLARAIIQRYGKDRTFSVPILTHCALAGRLGAGREAWRHVIPLPFELAACPHSWFAALRLPVVSYALPALIAIGQARHHHAPSRNPLARMIRNATRRLTLEVLTGIQPANGGFLEATPLTSFVVMSLAGSGQINHPVTARGLKFLEASQRPDGSWPIDTNLSTWLTTLAVNALGEFSTLNSQLSTPLRPWLLAQQYLREHPYTHAAPGGWAWTDLPGGVPDADDTAGALLALRHLCPVDADLHEPPPLTPSLSPSGGEDSPKRISRAEHLNRRASTGSAGVSPARSSFPGEVGPRAGETPALPVEVEATRRAVLDGITWLLELQNNDGGVPTFCRGWGALPFDRSSADITAHAIRAWLAWEEIVPLTVKARLNRAARRAVKFLCQEQRRDGAWIPLWFGNQFDALEQNPIYGTARVLPALTRAVPSLTGEPRVIEAIARGVAWLMSSQKDDGSWGGSCSGPSSVEETALALDALADVLLSRHTVPGMAQDAVHASVTRGTTWLMERVESGAWTEPSPIGFYFAKLWYSERLYPLIFTVGALNRVARLKF